jgi:hypothetical protein
LPNAPDVCLLRDKKNTVVGVDIQKFFSNVEKKGRQAEELFKQYLDNQNIPSLYIGQGLNGIEQLILGGDSDKIKRPDFLVTLPNFGHMFFDVKCRKKLGVKENKYFYLEELDFERLYNLQRKLMMPVWVAFGDADAVYRKTAEFYVAPVKILHSYHQALANEIESSIRAKIVHFFIPNELLCPLKEEDDSFSVRLTSASVIPAIVKNYADLHRTRIRLIAKEVYSLIAEQKLFKKEAVERLFGHHKESITHKEWDHFIKTDDRIKYKPYSSLQLHPCNLQYSKGDEVAAEG